MSTARDKAFHYIQDHLHARARRRRWRASARVLGRLSRVEQQVSFDDFFERRGKWPSWTGTWMYYGAGPARRCTRSSCMRKRRVPISPMIAIIAMVTVTAAISIGITRYRVGADVMLTVLGGVGLDALWRTSRPGRADPLAGRSARPSRSSSRRDRRSPRRWRPKPVPEATPVTVAGSAPRPCWRWASGWSRRSLVTWPLVTKLGHIGHDAFDPRFQAWTIDWVQHKLGSPGSMFDANIFAPEPHTLAYSDSLLGIAIPLLPLRWLGVSPIGQLNVALLLGFATSAASGYLFGRVVTRRSPSAR